MSNLTMALPNRPPSQYEAETIATHGRRRDRSTPRQHRDNHEGAHIGMTTSNRSHSPAPAATDRLKLVDRGVPLAAAPRRHRRRRSPSRSRSRPRYRSPKPDASIQVGRSRHRRHDSRDRHGDADRVSRPSPPPPPPDGFLSRSAPRSSKRPRSTSPLSVSRASLPKKSRSGRSPRREIDTFRPSSRPRRRYSPPPRRSRSRSPSRRSHQERVRDRRRPGFARSPEPLSSLSRRGRSRSLIRREKHTSRRPPSPQRDRAREISPKPRARSPLTVARGHTSLPPAAALASSSARSPPLPPPLRRDYRPATASDRYETGLQGINLQTQTRELPEASTLPPPPKSPRRRLKKKAKARGEKLSQYFDPASGANSIELNMSARGGGNYRGAFHPHAQTLHPANPQFGQSPRGPRASFSQSSGHSTPISSFHGSPPLQVTGHGRARGSQHQHFPHSHIQPSPNHNFTPPTGPHSTRYHSNSPPYPPSGPAAQFQHSPYRGSRNGGPGGPRGRSGERGGFPVSQWNHGQANKTGRAPDDIAVSQVGDHNSPPLVAESRASSSATFGTAGAAGPSAMEIDSQNPFRPSKDLQVEDSTRAEQGQDAIRQLAKEASAQPDWPIASGLQSQQPNKFSFSMKTTVKPVVTAPRPEISSKFNAAPPPRREVPQKPVENERRPPTAPHSHNRAERDRRERDLPRNVPTEPASARGRAHDRRAVPPSEASTASLRDRGLEQAPREPAADRTRAPEQKSSECQSRVSVPATSGASGAPLSAPSGPSAARAPRIRKVKKVMKRLRPKAKLPIDYAKSRSVFFRKPGNESVVGSGTYGKVFKGLNVYTKTLVALKKIRMEGERDGFPVTAVREIKLLRSLSHKNIVTLREVMVEANECFMVFEYLSHDLTGLLNHPNYQVDTAVKKDLSRQLFEGLDYLHTRGVLHRDIKAANILVSNDGILKLADFGLARFYSKHRQLDYTNRVITIWYRSPELLFGETQYGPAVDIWSAACVMHEIFTKSPIFPGDGSEINQLEKIYSVIGTPTKSSWPNLIHMPWFELLRPGRRKESLFETKYKTVLSEAAYDLMARMLEYDPAKRPTAAQVLQHSYFTQEEPKARQATELKEIPGDWHEFESKALRKERERKERERAEKDGSRRAGKESGGKDAAASAGRDKDRKRPNDSADVLREAKRAHVEGKPGEKTSEVVNQKDDARIPTSSALSRA